MKRTYEIIRKVAVAVCALIAMSGWLDVWGQQYISGNRYKTSYTRAPQYIFNQGDATITTDGGTTHGDVNDLLLENATWWQSDNNVYNDTYIQIDLKEAKRISRIYIVGSGSENTRPTYIQVSTSNNGRDWTQRYSARLSQQTRDIDITLNNTIQARYIRLNFWTGESNQIVVDRIRLYDEAISISNTANQTIQHKDAKWYSLRGTLSEQSKALDTFDDNTRRFINEYANNTSIQATHTYIDTLYVHKGQRFELQLPTVSNGENQNSAQKYQRWYNFRTEGTFRTDNNGNNECWDLLTPYFNENYADAYRFTNGYVGGHDLMANNESAMFGASFYYPTNTQFNDWNIENGEAGNDAYIVACDISGYTDFTSSFSTSTSHESDFSDNWYEPTIQLRVLYFIVGIDNLSERMSNSDFWKDGYGRLFDGTDYQGGYGANKKFLEEYQITFPADHISNFTDEIVALSKSARNYRIPGDGNSQSLHVSIVGTNSAGIELVSAKGSNNTVTNFDLSGDNRVIYFRKQSENPRTRWSVADNSTTTIIVTKVVDNTTYNIAKYELTFKEESRLLTQHQLERIDAENSTYLQDFANRTPNHLKENYELLTSRTFDYDPDVAGTYGQAEYYPYPLSWEYSSYAFYDGGEITDFDGSTTNLSQYNYQPFTEWGSYSIVNDYMGYDDKINGPTITDTDEHRGGRGTEGQDGYFLYVDASDLPGSIVTLPFEDNLCVGTELFVSAWVKSAGADISVKTDDWGQEYNDYANSSDDAAMLFTIYGVDANGNRTVLHRQSTGQIRKTTYNDSRQGDYNGTNGFGSNSNDWYQTYFSFINDNPANEGFKSYELQIDNNSASTQGGDFYLDDITIYIARPVPVVSQKEYTCVDERTLMNAYLDWGQLCERLGLDEDGTGSGESAIDFCFIDKVTYENAIANGQSEAEAIHASIESIGNGAEYDQTIATLYFKENFNSNNEYDDNKEGGNLAIDNGEGGKYYFYRAGNRTTRKLTVDFYATLSPYRQYEMLIIDHVGNTTADINNFAAIMNDKCGIRSEFYVEPQTLMKVNGEVVDPNQDFCEGQIFNFTAQVRVPTGTDSEGNDTYTILNDVNFDWFFGTEEEYNQQNTEFNGVSLNEALTQFREISAYRNYETLDGVTVQEAFTQDHIDIIQHYLEAEGEAGGLHKRLILCKPNLDISILGTGLQLVVRPIPVVRPSNITEDAWDKICWEYVPLLLEASQEAPVLHAGFNTIQYPTEDFNPSIRLGLDQIEKASSGSNTITIDLRGAKYASEKVTHLGLIESVTEGDMYQKIYLHSSDDPQYADILNNPDLSGEYSLPIGKITALNAREYTAGSGFNNYAKIQFDLSRQTLEDGSTFQFTPREGYTYTFSINYEEKGTGVYNTCWGKFPVTIKVVPEYLIWNGTNDGKSNWNNDDNWKRVNTPSRLKQNGSGYLDNNDTEKAFVPMLFSKVIMPENSKVELYAAGFKGNGNNDEWTGVENRPEGMGDPTENIQYDLMVFEHTASTNPNYNGQLKTERYRVSLLDQIYFEPGAEMLHAEYLLYNTAWVDYKLTKGRWYTLASPLQSVVAGDFYTDKDGQENSEYFTQIPDFNLTDNNRFQPSVYQRGWKGSNATLQTLNDGTKDVAIAGNWSSVYNDVDEKYVPGTGFSLKVQDVTSNNATFRLPKHDETYSYFSHGGSNGGNTSAAIDRSKYGKLKSDVTFTRNTNMNNAREGTNIEVPLTEVPSNTNNGTTYYLVGNPFMAHLDATKFFDDTNNPSLAKKYWLVNGDETSQTVAIGTMEDYVANNGDNTIAPLQSFFVTVAEGKDAPTSITFTRDMQVLGGTNDNLRSSDILYLTATTQDGKQSRAALAYNLAADKDYEASEDAELFLDSNLSDVPMVYTVAGTMAASINQTSELYNIPVGVYSQGATGENVSLTFSGLSGFSYATLYDAETGTDTPLHEGSSFNVPANTNGRYFIRAGVPTANEAVQENAIRIYSVGGQLVIASTDLLQQVYIYDFAGRLVDSETGLHTTRYTTDLPAGNYMVKARSVSGEKIEKFKLRN